MKIQRSTAHGAPGSVRVCYCRLNELHRDRSSSNDWYFLGSQGNFLKSDNGTVPNIRARLLSPPHHSAKPRRRRPRRRDASVNRPRRTDTRHAKKKHSVPCRCPPYRTEPAPIELSLAPNSFPVMPTAVAFFFSSVALQLQVFISERPPTGPLRAARTGRDGVL
ncbi:hypothetical protein GWI33_006073 [Rhynchophorus ferrugineus]|uniref:Uncharacterized protein n=1 Tax=Rhynchophorus ferrugineus TaxID=354439 RepID=A0A834IMH7_RHYFE|nr:hypothetical protein GWI33_006073 [Rhynchophorus ferrugineus]